MGLASDIRKRIEKKEQQIYDLEASRDNITIQIREATAALQAFQEILKLAPRDEEDTEQTEPNIRVGSAVALARDALRKHGRPLHISKLLEAIGRPATHDSRVSLSSGLSAYVRKNEVFTRPEPNVFGLREWEAVKEDGKSLTSDPLILNAAIDRVVGALSKQ
jgi:hypothetical protein